MVNFVLIGLGGLALNAVLMTLVAYVCIKARFLPGVEWRWRSRRTSAARGGTASGPMKSSIHVSGTPNLRTTQGIIYEKTIPGSPVVEIFDAQRNLRVVARNSGGVVHALAS
jgi:hypothetical protein